MKNNLTKREKEILLLVLDEQSSQSVAALLSLSIRTIETHRKNILRKTNVNTLIGLLKFAIKAGLIEDYCYNNSTARKNKRHN
ncbi:MAG: LuxR C-terminal-related transcriptional regulator [Bacteroidota bacterium]|nr:LuxR C-terminal-related transcriptional regulator [Bacteroidota bacterium]